MWNNTPISNSNYIVFRRFDCIVAIAKAMKQCHFFHLSREDRRLYGCNEEYYTLHAIDIPNNIEIPMNLTFRLSTINQDIVNYHKDFIFYPEASWMMLPLSTITEHYKYRPMYIGNSDRAWIMVDEQGNEVDHINLYGVDTTFAIGINILPNMVANRRAILPFLGEQQFFANKEKDELIQEVFANKTTQGTRYMRLTNINGKGYGFMLFKNLFSLNKNDTLTIIIRDRLDLPDVYQATFAVAKKKSPIPQILPTYVEYTYAMLVNI